MFIVIFILLTISLIKNFRKTVLIFTPFKFMIMGGVVLYGSITFDNAFSLVVCLCFLCNYKKYVDRNKPRWPLSVPFVLMIISESISACIGEPNYISIPLKICRNYGYCFVLYNLIKTDKDFRIILQSLVMFVFVLVGNGLVEAITHQNIIGDWLSNYLKETAFFIERSDYGSRGFRIHSFLAHSISFGDVCAIFLTVFLIIYKTGYRFKLQILTMLFLITGVLLSNSRTPILAMLIYCIPFLNFKEMNGQTKLLMFFGLICAFFVFGQPIYEILDSMFNEQSKYAVAGSDMTMRLEQLGVSFYVISHNPIFGLGYSFDFTVFEDLRGAESIWFNVLMYGGFFAVICYISIYVTAVMKSKEYALCNYLRFLTLGYLVQQTATYNAGLNESLFYVCFIMLLCFEHIYKKKILK